MGGGRILKNLFDLSEDVAVVTGASGNLGPIWVEALLNAGASVMAIDRPEAKITENLQRLLSRFEKSRLTLAQADIRDRSALDTVNASCRQNMGTPSILVNNAGIDRPPSQPGKGYALEEIPLEENREIFEVNTLGLFTASQVFGSQMAHAGSGTIINIGSLYASVSPDMRFYNHIPSDPPFLKPPAYGASKAAVVNLTRYLATYWAPYGVRVNALSPGGVLGAQDEEFKRKFCQRVPMGRMATDDDLVGPLLFLASRASSYVTGIELVVDGGYTSW
jgi:NAD(P)-dependent dehydrogenase (short-subunit alcohol dehydrogenase family)